MLMNVHTGTYIPSGGGGNKGLRQTMRVRGEAVEGRGGEERRGGRLLVGCHLAAIERKEGRKEGQIVFTVRPCDRQWTDK